MNKFDFNKLTPFKWFVLENFPFIEADFDALTEWQLFCKLGKEINKIINSENTLGTQMENVTNAFIELQNYVNNYFANLDVQEEINNKLNEMAESGQLTEIIGQYINLHGVLAFNTVADMKAGENLVENSICRTLGFTTYNDGKGSFYKIRNITSSDVVDNVNIIPINNSSTLIAEKIKSKPSKKYIFMGDSYGDGYTPDGNVTSWITLLAQKMNLSASDYISSHMGGYGFSINRADYNYIKLLQNIASDDNITDIYVCGGYNDAGQTESNIIQGIADFYQLVKTKFVNAKLHLAFIGWSKNSPKIASLKDALISYKKACNNNSIDFLVGCEYSLHNYFKYFSSDGIHPNQTGQNSIANALYNAIKFKNANVLENEFMYFTLTNGSSAGIQWLEILSNGQINISQHTSSISALNFTDAITITGNNLVEIGELTNSLIVGTDVNDIGIKFTGVVNDGTNQYSQQEMILVIKNGKLYLGSQHASGGSYGSINVKNVQIIQFNGTFNALIC